MALFKTFVIGVVAFIGSVFGIPSGHPISNLQAVPTPLPTSTNSAPDQTTAEASTSEEISTVSSVPNSNPSPVLTHTMSNSNNSIEAAPVAQTTPLSERKLMYNSQGDITSYSEDDNYVYYGSKPIPNSDPSSFILLASGGGYAGYAKDKNQVYWYGQIISGADPVSFELIGMYSLTQDSYAKDRSHVYENQDIIADADLPTFTVLEGYSKDKNFVYCQGDKLSNANPTTFEVLFAYFPKDNSSIKSPYGTDGIHVYAGCTPLANVDSASFTILSRTDGSPSGYTKDKDRVYFRDTAITGADSASFVLGGQSSDAQDKNNHYRYGVVVDDTTYYTDRNGHETPFLKESSRFVQYTGINIPDADPETFTVISDVNGNGTDFAKDAKYVFFQNKKLPDADPNTFTLFFYRNGKSSGYAKDSLHIYYNFPHLSLYGSGYYAPDVLRGADVASFKVIVSKISVVGFAQDKNTIYCFGVPIPGVKNSSFSEVMFNGAPTDFFVDASNVYYLLRIESEGTWRMLQLPNAHAATFAPVLDDTGNMTSYAKDDQTVFYDTYVASAPTGPLPIVGADATTFHAVSPPQSCNPNPTGNCFMNAQDRNHGYYNGAVVQQM